MHAGDSNDVIRTASSASTPQKPSAASPRPSQASEGDDDEQPPFSLATLGAVVRDGLSLRTQWEFLKLGLPGGLMMAAEASSFDITTALAGILGQAAPAAAAAFAWSSHAPTASALQCRTLSMLLCPCPHILSAPQSAAGWQTFHSQAAVPDADQTGQAQLSALHAVEG